MTQIDQFTNGFVLDDGYVGNDAIDFDAIVDGVQADGVGHTKSEVEAEVVRAALAFAERESSSPAWFVRGITAYVRRGLNRSYSRVDGEGLLLYPAVDDHNRRKGRDYMTRDEYQYVIRGLLEQSESLLKVAQKLEMEAERKFGTPLFDEAA